MLLGSNWRNELVVPGPLCSHHAQVLRGAGWENRCNACHAAGNQSVGGWLSAVVENSVGPTQSDKCMVCHDKTLATEFALSPHNLPDEQLLKRHGESHGNVPRELACSICHQEHQGADHAIAAMDDARCQSCHTQQFESFATDHPELGIWPYDRRTPIAFSHTTHEGKYFAEKNQPFACLQCHVEDSTGNVQKTLSYKVACAQCHDEEIATSLAEGVAMLALPSVDLDTLAEAGMDLGAWPEMATGDFDGALPAMMKLLLDSDPKARKARELLGADFEFYDIDPDDPEQLQAAADLTLAIKQLLSRLANSDPNSDANLREQARPPIRLAMHAWKQWMEEASAPPERRDEEDLPRTPGTWFLENRNLSIRSQPTGHADPVLRAWIDLAASTSDPEMRETLLKELAGPHAPGRCGTCHSQDQGPSGQILFHWRSHDRRLDPRGFTRFSHAPHLLQAELRDCTACHRIDTQADTSGNYTGLSPGVKVCDFEPMSKATCANCHTKSVVGDSCTQCHNYHVGRPLETVSP